MYLACDHSSGERLRCCFFGRRSEHLTSVPCSTGFETPILQGGEALFKKYNVWFIMAECNKDIIKEEGQKEFLK